MNASRITLNQAELLAAETRHVLGLPAPIPIMGMRSSARLVPARPTATAERTEVSEKVTVEKVTTEGQLYAILPYAQRAKLKSQDPKVYNALKAANQAEREQLKTKLSQTKAMADRAAIRAELAKL